MNLKDIKKIQQYINDKKNIKERSEQRLNELIEEAREIDAKKAKKKAKSKEEKQEEQLKAMLEYESLIPDDDKAEDEKYTNVVHDSSKEWDVRKEDTIEYFDPTLSYELTGYRPITATEGLDFNPKLFTEAADSYRKNGRYTNHMPGTFKNKQFWDEEWNRCVNGYTVGKYTLTGQNYFWLNYYRLQSNISDNMGEEVRVEDFPGFLAKQYEYFHYLGLCEKLKKDGIAFKARGVK